MGKKQDIMVADGTSTCRFTVWEDECGKFTKGECYQLSGVHVREFRGIKFLSTSRDVSITCHKIPDIGIVQEPEKDDVMIAGEVPLKINDARVVGVVKLQNYKACMKCNSKVQEESESLGRCGKCEMMQNVEVCKEQWMAEILVVSGERAKKPLNLRAFGHIIAQIAGQPNITEASLLTAKPFSLTYSEGSIIQSVKRKKLSK